jgi:hypothetical protein
VGFPNPPCLKLALLVLHYIFVENFNSGEEEFWFCFLLNGKESSICL